MLTEGVLDTEICHADNSTESKRQVSLLLRQQQVSTLFLVAKQGLVSIVLSILSSSAEPFTKGC